MSTRSCLEYLEYLEEHKSQFLGEMLEFLRIPSISSLPEHAGDVNRAGEWVVRRLHAAGLENVRMLPTGGHPVVTADWLHAAGRPTILLYGHFDTQPVDPLHLWTNPPFEPTLRDGHVYARGASDDKGNMLIPILAMEALLKTSGALPVNVRCFFEGQEEIGSPQIPAFLDTHRDEFACDMVISADSGQFSSEQPALLVGCRGLCAVQITARGARTDLHSGIYGGTVANPIHALAQILSTLRDTDGKILVAGFYDSVVPLGREQREQLARIPFDEAAYCAQVGVDTLFGEAGYTPVERVWVRPTLEVNGIWGGFQGEGVKTVLPNEAHAKITCRLVPDQDPHRIPDLVRQHVERQTLPGVHVEVRTLPGTARPYRIPDDHPGNRAAADVLRETYGREPFTVRTGGSIPVCEMFQNVLGAYTVGFGFAQDDEQFHAPDEFFRISSFERGQEAYCRLLQRLGMEATA